MSYMSDLDIWMQEYTGTTPEETTAAVAEYFEVNPALLGRAHSAIHHYFTQQEARNRRRS